jgi:hypothetical protein
VHGGRARWRNKSPISIEVYCLSARQWRQKLPEQKLQPKQRLKLQRKLKQLRPSEQRRQLPPKLHRLRKLRDRRFKHGGYENAWQRSRRRSAQKLRLEQLESSSGKENGRSYETHISTTSNDAVRSRNEMRRGRTRHGGSRRPKRANKKLVGSGRAPASEPERRKHGPRSAGLSLQFAGCKRSSAAAGAGDAQRL